MFKLSLILTYMLALVATFKTVLEARSDLVKKLKPLATVSWNG